MADVVPFGKKEPPVEPHVRFEVLYGADWGNAMEKAHDAYMERLRAEADAFDADDSLEGVGAVDADGFPFCGCDTCERRASWNFVMAWALAGNEDGVVELVERQEP